MSCFVNTILIMSCKYIIFLVSKRILVQEHHQDSCAYLRSSIKKVIIQK